MPIGVGINDVYTNIVAIVDCFFLEGRSWCKFELHYEGLVEIQERFCHIADHRKF